MSNYNTIYFELHFKSSEIALYEGIITARRNYFQRAVFAIILNL